MKDYLGYSTLMVLLTEAIKEETGMEHRECRLMAGIIKNGLAKKVKGSRLYIPNKDPVEIAARRAAIRRDWDRTTASRERLQRQYGISKATFYRIIKPD